MGDEMTPGEMHRWIDDLRQGLRATNDRITQSARESVSASLWTSENRAIVGRIERHERDALEVQKRLEETLGREIRDLKALIEREVEDLREEIKELRAEGAKRGEVTWQKVTGLVGALAAIALVIVTLLSSGGH